MFREIASNKNTVVKRLKELTLAKARREYGTFLIEGPKLLHEAYSSGYKIKTVLSEERFAETDGETLKKLEAAGADVYIASRAAIDAASDAKTPQGVVAEAMIPDTASMPEKGLLVALDGVQDPGNMGTVLRSADAFGACAVLLSKECADVWSPKCVRSAMGSSFHIPILRRQDFVGELKRLKDDGFLLIAGHLKGEASLPNNIGDRAVLLIGSEGRGLSDETSAAATHLFRLEMKGRAESLNAAVCAGILLYELSGRMN